ncbi:MAG TPA: alpha-amylase family glycosyl hydrolase, partial [Lacipirellulaceae bacterium]|nr:alpha-amylase family glycosyl hydrolase [Lacipirellulaceae bacterium]
DHHRFAWNDNKWRGTELLGQIIYELHLGTFTPDGTWRAAAEKLTHLRDIGVTLVEIMPIAAFPGKFGWGYDGVCWYAPVQLYGTPDDARHFVDRAHAFGMGVILDVVYNHLGPSGNYTGVFSSYFSSAKHKTDWGDAINYDGPHSEPVRDFVADNAAYWIREFHFDGLRLDAVHSIVDDSPEHIVAKLSRAARAAAGQRSIVIFSEDDLNRGEQALPADEGGWGVDGVWSDDFHHACRVAATGHAEAYYHNFAGTPQELVSSIRHGYLYQGQWNARRHTYRGSPSWNITAPHFVHFLQNHDHVANSARALRTHSLTSPGRYRALTALLLLGPQTPLLFMGQEFAASNPFYFFADHEPELAKLVCRGRREFMSQFARFASFHGEFEPPDPTDDSAFLPCKLDWDEVQKNDHVMRLHRDLIRLRREDSTFSRQDNRAIDGSVIGHEAFLLRWFDKSDDDRLALFNLGCDIDWQPIAEPLIAPPSGRKWTLQWSSEEPCYGGLGTPGFDGKNWRIPGHAAVIFRAEPQ